MASIEQTLSEVKAALEKEHVDVAALIQGIQLDDPRLYQILMELNRGMGLVQDELFPLVIKDRIPASAVPILPAPTSFSFIFTPVSVRFNWSEVATAYGYEIRQGSVWDSAFFELRTASLQADIDPLLVGTYTFLIKTINAAGVYSNDQNSLVITVIPIGTITLRAEVIDNNVLLSWSIPTSTFRILHYRVIKDGDEVGTVDSSFFSTFENVAGLYTYGVYAIDVAGNRGPAAFITVEVNTPPDYALQDSRVSDLTHTKVNVIRDPVLPSLIITHQPQTWEEHFVNFSWDQISDQIDAGYPIYIQPTIDSGSYEEIIDYGLIIQNTIVTITYNQNIIVPDFVVTIKMAVSNDGVSYTPFTAGSSQFMPSLRYFKFRLEFDGETDKSLMELWQLTISLSVKRENDGGEVNALLTDVGGTTVYFSKEFKDIESITCTTKSITEPYVVIFDFVDIPNPTFFKVYVFDTTGNRVTKIVDWKARGII